MAQKITQQELAEVLNEFLEERARKRAKKAAYLKIFTKLRRAVSIPIIIGVLAAILMYMRFGPRALEETLLSWTIGLTILAAIITLLERLSC